MRRPFLCALLAAGLAVPLGAASEVPASAPTPSFEFPVACTLGKDCWIQHYVDRDPSPAARDYMCGTLTYEGHKGTDIRIPDMAAERAGVNVLAAADGKVLRLRDGMEDVSVRIAGLQSVEGTECGNGLVIDHDGGWQTQYCHMAKGSLVVKPGDAVRAGQPLGRVGLSGETEFPHLHISFWRNGVIVDPFAPDPPGDGAHCGGGVSVWRKTPAYVTRSVINAGFSAQPIDMAGIEAGGEAVPDDRAPYVVAYVRTIGLRAGDQPSLVLSGPGGVVLAPSPPFAMARAADQRFLMVGKRQPAQGWPKGVYHARYVVKAGDRIVLQRDFETTIR